MLLFNFLFKRQQVMSLRFLLSCCSFEEYTDLELISRSAVTAPVPDRTDESVPVPVPFGKRIWPSSVVVDLSRRVSGSLASFSVSFCSLQTILSAYVRLCVLASFLYGALS